MDAIVGARAVVMKKPDGSLLGGAGIEQVALEYWAVERARERAIAVAKVKALVAGLAGGCGLDFFTELVSESKQRAVGHPAEVADAGA